MAKLFNSDGTVFLSDNIADVTEFGAVGDGTTDDYSAIQSAIDSVSDGGTVFFPTGTYLITQSLKVYSKQVIELNGSTILQGASITNLLRGYSTTSIGEYDGTHDTVIQNGTFDGGSYTTNNTLVGFCHSKNVTIRNCAFVNAYGAWHNLEINSSKWFVVDNCTFEGTRKNNSNGCMIQVDSYDSAATWPWSDGKQDNTVSYLVEIKNCHFYGNTVSPAIGNHSSTNIQYLRIHDCTFEGLTTTRCAIAFQSSLYVDVYNNTFIGCTNIVDNRSGSNWTVHDNRIVGATGGMFGFASAYKNMVDGTLTN